MTPLINSIGAFKVKTPFTTVEDGKYTCIAIANFTALKKRSIDIYNTYYQPFGLLEADYLTDAENDTSIVTLSDSEGVLTYIPTSYITEIPSQATVPYSQTYVMFSLKALPDGLSMESTLDLAQSLLEDNLGVSADYKILTLPVTDAVTVGEDEALEAARLANINLQPSPRKDLANALETNAKLRERVSDLETIFLNQ